MVFSSEKKELWRYASRNNVNCSAGVGNNRQQQLHRHQHLHRLQSPPPDYYATTTRNTSTTKPTVITTCLTDDNRLNQQQQQQLEEHNMPPPPYSSVPCGIDCSETCQQRRMSTTSSNCGNFDVGMTEDGGGSGSGNGSSDRYSIGGISYIDGKSAFTCASVSSSRSISSFSSHSNNKNNNMERNEHDWKYNNNYNMKDNKEENVVVCDQLNNKTTTTTTATIPTSTTRTSTTTSTTIPIVTSTASVLAATAASIFRNCCGGSGGEGGRDVAVENGNQSSSSLTITCPNNNTSSGSSSSSKFNKQTILLAKNCNTTTTMTSFSRRQYFDAFMKHLKEGQVTVLLKAVKSRLDPVCSLTALYQHRQQQHQQQASHCCILVHRALIMNEELHVIACRLFFWAELKDGSELKPLPDCPNHCDPMYVCCNPLHWCRIFKAETAPPPYQLRSTTSDKMQYNDTTILENGRGQNIENNVPIRQNYLLANQNIVQNLCVQIPESVATAGEDAQACSLIWCQLAYWELRQRVGPLYMAKKSCVNVYADTPQHDALSEGMCLKDLSAINTNNLKDNSVSEDVQYTRRKIGLGVTLSQEADGVWLYNRSRVPIFLHSPTLSESWFRVCRILPGECVKAFDTHRAHSLYTLPYDSSQMGRVDTFSMRLSFAKGWGCNYKRQDITRCPCWLEVFFTQR